MAPTTMLVDTWATSRCEAGYCAAQAGEVPSDSGPVYSKRTTAARVYASLVWHCDLMKVRAHKISANQYRVTKEVTGEVL